MAFDSVDYSFFYFNGMLVDTVNDILVIDVREFCRVSTGFALESISIKYDFSPEIEYVNFLLKVTVTCECYLPSSISSTTAQTEFEATHGSADLTLSF